MNKNNHAEKQKEFHLPKRLAGFWWILVVILATVIIALGGGSGSVDVKEGEYAPSNVYYYGSATTFVSQEQTEAAKQLAASEVSDIYETDEMAIVNAHKAVDGIFEQIYTIRSSSKSLETKYEEVSAVFNDEVSTSAIDYYMNMSDLQIRGLLNDIKDVITVGYEGSVAEADLPDLATKLDETVDATDKPAAAKELMKGIIGLVEFTPNKVVNEVATTDAINKAMENVQPIQVTVNPGELIVRRGEVVTPTIMETLMAVGLVTQSNQMLRYLGILILVSLSFFVVWAYCGTLKFPNQQKERSVVVLTLIMLAVLLVGRLLTLISFNTTNVTDLMLGLLIPVPAFSLLASALVNKRTAILGTVILSLFIGVMCSGNILYVMAAILGGLVGVIETSRMNQRNQYIVMMLYISVTYCLTLLAWSFIWGYSLSYISAGLIVCALNGVISVIVAIGALPMLETIFGITTSIRLLELSNTNHPLLKKLMIEAPGTYNHSVLVGNLAEAAANEINANGLLVRVASYFHDIGKIKRPYLFIENQKSGDNPHDKLRPSLSTFVITSHTKNGAELARKYKLPKEVVDIILQHHGTGLVVGFYKKAQANAIAKGGKAEDVLEENFRYPGPVPQTKEAALVMLADSCQAAVLSMTSPTRGQIEGKVREVIRGKFNDGQLDQCDLTFRDLHLIGTAFVNVLAGAHHKRIPYPDQLERELRNRANENRKQKDTDKKLANKNGSKGMTEAELEKAVNESLEKAMLDKKGQEKTVELPNVTEIRREENK